MGVAAPTKMVEAFAINAPVGNVPGGKTVPFPVASQVAAGLPGRASLSTGFTPANMTPLNESGIPMSGPDTQGILYLATTTIAAVSAGQLFNVFDGTYAAAIGGYNLGAQVLDATNGLKRWTSAIAANTTDPAVTPANWISSIPLYSAPTITAGTHADNTLSGPSDFILDVNTTSGSITLNGFVSQRDGQKLVISNIGTNSLVIGFLAGTAANQVRASGASGTLLQNDSLTIQYVSAVSRWVVV